MRIARTRQNERKQFVTALFISNPDLTIREVNEELVATYGKTMAAKTISSLRKALETDTPAETQRVAVETQDALVTILNEELGPPTVPTEGSVSAEALPVEVAVDNSVEASI
jgi:hypothetical protein